MLVKYISLSMKELYSNWENSLCSIKQNIISTSTNPYWYLVLQRRWFLWLLSITVEGVQYSEILFSSVASGLWPVFELSVLAISLSQLKILISKILVFLQVLEKYREMCYSKLPEQGLNLCWTGQENQFNTFCLGFLSGAYWCFGPPTPSKYFLLCIKIWTSSHAACPA